MVNTANSQQRVMQRARWIGLLSGALTLAVVAPIWFAAGFWLDLRAGGTLGGYGAPPEAGNAPWLLPSQIGVTLVSAGVVLFSARFFYRRSLRRRP